MKGITSRAIATVCMTVADILPDLTYDHTIESLAEEYDRRVNNKIAIFMIFLLKCHVY